MERKFRLFVDMDGTLAEFQKVSAMEELYERGYFAQLPPQQNVVDTLRLLIHTTSSVDVFILSSVLFDSRFAMEEKNGWLNKYLPEIDRAHRIFLPCGESKAGYVPGTLREGDCLLDDYTKNLVDWNRAGGRGIKLLNGINHTQRSWSGARISIDRPPAQLAGALLKVADGHCVLDERPSFAISAVARELQRVALNTEPQYEPDL